MAGWKKRVRPYNPMRNPPGVDSQGNPVEPVKTQIELSEIPDEVKKRLQEVLDRQQEEAKK